MTGEKTEKTKLKKSADSSLPEAAVVLADHTDYERVTKLLKEAGKLKCRIDEDDARLKVIQADLIEACVMRDLKGVRHGRVGFEYRGYHPGRQTLSKEMLIDNGVSAEQIAASFKTGEPYLDVRVILFDI